MRPTFSSFLLAAAIAPLVVPLTGGWLFFALVQWFEPSLWGLPPLHSLIGVSFNSTLVGYVFTWFFGLPLALALKWINHFRVGYLLAAGAVPALTLPFWQTGWTISILPVFLAGTSTAYVFWLLTRRVSQKSREPESAVAYCLAEGSDQEN